jgi:inosine-uridine nucleoside N-ribohydrolase
MARRHPQRIGFFLVACCVLCASALAGASASAQERRPIVLDTDLGSDLGDAVALALALASPELDLRGVTTVGGDTQVRALMACRFLTMTGRRHIPVAAGAAPQPERAISATGAYRYYYHPDVVFNRTTRPLKESAVDFLYARLKAQPAKITLVAAGPLTNVARLLDAKPECKPWLGRIILSGANIAADVKAAQTVFAAGVPLVVLPKDVTANLKLDEAEWRRVFSPLTPLSLQVQTLHQLWEGPNPSLADALAVALCADEGFCKLEEGRVHVDDQGALHRVSGAPNARVATALAGATFQKWLVERMENCVAPAKRPAKLVAPGGMPHRVHVAEDFETDIERFWWMSGKAETHNLPAGSRRACRGVLTHDFDDLLGSSKAMYTAVIFNPVPGPPMGKQTRLSFRYWLRGSDSLRVQIYSLTNGYHRHLVVTGLPQGRWESATVDMTLARRPDGTGGPLAEGERIDDIQFYADPSAELLIDDIVLYDAAASAEKRPFPRHVHFAAGFDTGQQGKQWPGTFEIVPDKGYFWRAARSVPKADGSSWIRLGLRGARPLGETTRLSFRYHLTGADRIQVVLLGEKSGLRTAEQLTGLKTGVWAEATVAFATRHHAAEEIHLLLPAGTELLLDDLVLYEPDADSK